MTVPVGVPDAPGLVVVGAGLAGVRAVEAARRAGFTGTITLIGAETETPYDRPPLSKTFLTEGAALKHLRADDALLSELDVDMRLGATATALSSTDRVVTVDGQDLPFEALVIATGSAARRLPGMHHLAGVHTLRSHGDAVALRKVLVPGSRVVVVGAGFVGSEIACSAAAMGAQVTVLEAAAVPLVRAVGEQMGAALAQLHARRGVEVRCGVSVDSLVGSDRVEAVRLADGELLPAEVVLIGVGAAPQTDWLVGSGLRLDDGILCDRTLNAGVPGIYAAGDVARWLNPTFDAVMRLEHWTAAAEQGAIAGQNAVNPAGALVCETVPYFWSDWGADRIQFVGIPGGDEVQVVAGDPAVGDFLALYRTGDRVTGALGLNHRRPVVRLRMMIGKRAGWTEAVELGRTVGQTV